MCVVRGASCTLGSGLLALEMNLIVFLLLPTRFQNQPVCLGAFQVAEHVLPADVRVLQNTMLVQVFLREK